MQTILRLSVVKSKSGLSKSTLYEFIKQGLWTKQVIIGKRAVGWPSSEVEAINAARISGQTEKEIRELVLWLEAGRKATK